MKFISNLAVRYRWPVVICVLVITIVLGLQIAYLQKDADALNSLPKDDPAAKLYKEIGEKFSGSFMVMVVLESDSIFTKSGLLHVKQITNTIKLIDGVSSVLSLTSMVDIKDNEGIVEIGNLVDENNLPTNDNEIESLKNYILSKKIYKGTILSNEASSCLITAIIDENYDKQKVSLEIQNKVEALKLPEKIFFGGLPIMMNEVSKSMESDLAWLLPLVVTLVSLILFFCFRSFIGVFFPLLTALISLIWTLGTMSMLGYKLNIISNNIPIILFAVGSAYTIHFINKINHFGGNLKKVYVVLALTDVAVPISLSALTTAIGFISFVFGAYLTTIFDFGIFASIGTIYALILTLFFTPACIAILSDFNLNTHSSTSQINSDLVSKIILNPIFIALMKYRRLIIIGWILLCLTCLFGIFFIHVNVNMQDYFSKDNLARQAESIMQEKFGGSQPVFIRFKGDMQSPMVLNKMLELADFLEKDENVSNTISIAHLIQEVNKVMGEEEKVPDTKNKIEQLWFLLEGQDILEQLVTDDMTEGILHCRFKSTSTRAMENFIENVSDFIDKNSTKSCVIELSGIPSLYVTMMSNLTKSLFYSIGIAVLLVFFIVSLVIKSVKYGLLATTPIIASTLILFGIMGAFNIALDVATVLVASVVIGIGIDYSIHVINSFNLSLKTNNNLWIALSNTLQVSGKAIVFNVLSVSAGFLVLLFSELVPLKFFGALVAISMISSGLGALTLLPALLLSSKNEQL